MGKWTYELTQKVDKELGRVEYLIDAPFLVGTGYAGIAAEDVKMYADDDKEFFFPVRADLMPFAEAFYTKVHPVITAQDDIITLRLTKPYFEGHDKDTLIDIKLSNGGIFVLSVAELTSYKTHDYMVQKLHDKIAICCS